jgi:hypothetical protein
MDSLDIDAKLSAALAEAGGALASALQREKGLSLSVVQRRFAWTGLRLTSRFAGYLELV